MKNKTASLEANENVNRDAEIGDPTSEDVTGGSGSTYSSATNLRGLYDKAHTNMNWRGMNPFQEFAGKTIHSTSYLPVCLTLYFTDGTKGYVDLCMNSSDITTKTVSDFDNLNHCLNGGIE